MPRILRVAAVQVGTVNRTDEREHTLGRLVSLLEEAAAKGAQVAVYPELTFTTFFPRYFIEGDELGKVSTELKSRTANSTNHIIYRT